MNYLSIVLLIVTLYTNSSIMAQGVKIGNYKFKKGGEYQGELYRGKPHGHGKAVFKNGDTYESK